MVCGSPFHHKPRAGGQADEAFNIKTHIKVEFVDTLHTNIELVHNMHAGLCETSIQHISFVHCALYTAQTNTLYINTHKRPCHIIVKSLSNSTSH